MVVCPGFALTTDVYYVSITLSDVLLANRLTILGHRRKRLRRGLAI